MVDTIRESEDIKDKWHLERWAKFTASENHKLLALTGQTALFSPGAWTYIRTKAMQSCTRMWERPELEEVKSLLHGKMYEYPAYDAYTRATNNSSMIYLGSENPLFLEYEELKGESGGSPDAININPASGIDILAEIKCPKNPMYHWERLKWTNQWDVKEGYVQCYCQIQNLLMITGAPMAHFVSYDERMVKENAKIKIIEIKPDRKFQDNLHFRLVRAIQEKHRDIEEHMSCYE